VRAPRLTLPRGGDPVALVVALVRVAVVPVAVVGQLWTQPPGTELELLEVVFPVAAAYALLTLAFALSGRRAAPPAVLVVADIALLGLIAYGAGGAEAHIRFAFGIPPIVAAFLGRPRQTAGLAVATVACFAAVVVLAPAVGEPTPARTAAVAVIDLAWRNALVVAMSILLARREARIRSLAEGRRALVTQSLRAEDRARRELAYVLHDDVVQSLLSVRQDLTSAERGRRDAIGRAREVLESTVGALRDEISHLHPHQLETLGLAAAIRAVAEQKGRAGGFTVDVVVRDDAVGVHDELLLALARELLQNVAKHAGARRVRLDVRLEMDALVLRCTDDGRGFRTPSRGAALDDGHLGLAACTERVEAVGGVMEVRSAPGRGTVVRAALPPNALLRSSRSFNRVP
jgi:two-component system, NarL family, sensor kinase